MNIFLERFVNDTVDYHIHYVGVDSLDEECIECRKYSDYCEHQGKRIKNNYYYNHHFSVIIKEKW